MAMGVRRLINIFFAGGGARIHIIIFADRKNMCQTLYSWLATNILVHTRQCSLIKSQNRPDMEYLFCDKLFFCAMPPDMAADIKNRENVKIRPVHVLSPSRRRETPCEGTNSPRLFTPGEMKALAKFKVHQWSRAWLTNSVGWVVILTDLKNMADCHE
jgi:hypothetical protein